MFFSVLKYADHSAHQTPHQAEPEAALALAQAAFERIATDPAFPDRYPDPDGWRIETYREANSITLSPNRHPDPDGWRLEPYREEEPE